MTIKTMNIAVTTYTISRVNMTAEASTNVYFYRKPLR